MIMVQATGLALLVSCSSRVAEREPPRARPPSFRLALALYVLGAAAIFTVCFAGVTQIVR